MKNVLKKYFKFIIGIAVLVIVLVFFIQSRRTNSLESGQLADWRKATTTDKSATIKILVATDEHNELMVQCVDKMATLPGSDTIYVRDAAELCFIGIKLREVVGQDK